MKHLSTRLVGVTSAAVVLLGLFAGPAAAWDHPECEDHSHGSPPAAPEHHYPSHPSAPPAPAPAPPAPAPAATPAPAPAPVAPAPAAPVPAPAPATPAPTPAPETESVSKPKAPQRGVLGETGTKQEVAPTTPVALIQSGGQKADTLPVTGLNVGIQAIFGALFLMAGAAMFRRSSHLA